MNEHSATGPARPWPRWLRSAALASVPAAIVLLAAACGGSSAGANTFAPGATQAQSLAFAKCMRANGVPSFPDPGGQGTFNNAQVQALTTGPQGDNALHQCRSVLPNAGTGLTVTQIQEIQQQNLRNAVKSAHCMRAHGIANFPDPAGSTQSSGVNWQPVISATQTGGLNLNTPSYEAAYKTCGRPIPPFLAPGAVPPPGAGGGS